VTLRTGYRASGLIVFFQILVTFLAGVMIGLFQFDYLSFGFKLVASRAFFHFLSLLPNILAILELMVTISAF
jgi:hypothetical protein